jgi:hypothetical protein
MHAWRDYEHVRTEQQGQPDRRAFVQMLLNCGDVAQTYTVHGKEDMLLAARASWCLQGRTGSCCVSFEFELPVSYLIVYMHCDT